MRSLPVHSATIQIASATGDRRYINVSGLAKAQLVWLFRNFSILDFSVLTKRQQELVAQVWYAGYNAAPRGAALDLIGTIEGFTPHHFAAPRRLSSDVPVAKPRLPGGESGQPRSPLPPAPRWSSVVVVLLLCALFVRLTHLRSKRSAPQPVAAQHEVVSPARVVAPDVVRSRASDAIALADVSPGLAPAIAAAPDATASGRANSVPETAVQSPLASTSAPVPPAMARNESVENFKTERATSAVAEAHPEVLIRVRVDERGRAQSYDMLQGDRKILRAAEAAARRWNFQPCAGTAVCEYTLRFTDYGDTSVLQSAD